MKKHLAIRLFGAPSIEMDGNLVTGLGTRKAEALLIYLVCQKRPFSRELLADLLWDDRPQDQALANLRSLLSGLNKQFKPFLNVSRHTVAFNHDSDYWLDVAEFSEWLQVAADSPDSPLPALEKAANLYRGDFLEGFNLREARTFEEWSLLERERLRRLGEQALQELVRYHLAAGSYAAGNQFADQLLKLNNLGERANRYKMLLLARSGWRNVALQQYERYRDLLAEELGVEPAAETTAVYHRIQSAQTTLPHNLPPSATPFVGRSQELADFQQQLINPACRLLTLLGPGGMGKTRLTLATAERIVQQQPGLFLNGIRFIPLAAIPTPDLLITAVADACGFSLQGQEPPLQQLVSYLQDKEMLLLLDNFEHLFGAGVSSPDGIDILLKLLQTSPLLQILVTSRERLHVQEEWLFDLAGLDYPPEPPEKEASAYSAVQLFQQNAARIQRQFTPKEADWAAMAQVCRLLEGMPLGIELASAWIRDFSCPEIAEQIQTDVDFLATKLRNVPPRHRSVTAVFDHSWALLSAEEQAAFAKLSCFRGSFSAEAAAVVAQAAPALLARFCDKSLLRKGENPATEPGRSEPDRRDRYDLHELLRHYAADKLALTAAIQEETAVRHMNYYLEKVAALENGETEEDRHTIQTDLPNIRQAWQTAVSQKNYLLLTPVTEILHAFFSIQSKFQEGIDLFQFALDRLASAQIAEPEAAQALCDLWGRKARLHIHIGQLPAARSALDEAVALLPLVEDPERHAVILSYIAITIFYAGDFDRAAEMMTTALRLAEETGDEKGIAFAHGFLGSCAKALGDYVTAENQFKQSIRHYRQIDDELGAAMSLNNLGNVAQARGDFAEAQARYLECSAIFKALDHTHGAATTLANAGQLALKQGQHDDAYRLLSESLALKRAQKDARGTAVALVGLGAVSLETGAYGQAQAELSEGLALAQSCGDVKVTLEGLSVLAALATRQGHPQAAAATLAFILNHKATVQEVRDNAELFMAEAEAALAERERVEARARGQEMDMETAVARLTDLLP